MHRTFIALVLSASLGLTGLTATAARADDTAEWITGLAALAIIGLAIAENQNKPKSYYAPRGGHAGDPLYYAPKPQYQPYYHQPKTRTYNSKALPSGCRVTENLQGHKVRGLSRSCLKRHYADAKHLPQGCLIKLRDPYTNERRPFYEGRCLRDHGYTLARKGH